MTRPYKYAGTHIIYRIEDVDCPIPQLARQFTKVGDWLQDDDGYVLQVLTIRIFSTGRGGQNCTMVSCLGIDFLWRRSKTGSCYINPLHFKRPRKAFNMAGSTKKTKLTSRDKLFLRLLIGTADPTKAYLSAYGDRKLTDSFKRNLTYHIKRLLDLEQGKEFVSILLRDAAKEAGLDAPEFYLNNLKDAVTGGVKNEFQLGLLRLLAMSGGNIEIINLLPKSTGDGGASLPLPDAKKVEASFTEIPNQKQLEEVKT